MKNFVREGDVQTLIAPSGGVVSGGVYLIGGTLCVATADAAQGAEFEGKIRGVFTVTKVGSQAWATPGTAVYWDNGNTRFTTTAGSNRLSGSTVSVVGSGAGETTGQVYLDGTVR